MYNSLQYSVPSMVGRKEFAEKIAEERSIRFI
jgi:hypothetical protein